MTEPLDLHPATEQLAAVVRAVPDGALDAPTPCEGLTVADLLHHVSGLPVAFGAAARKELGAATDRAPEPDGQALDPAWRTAIPTALDELARAWRDPAAWEGMTRAGGVDLPGDVAGLVVLDELVVHGWDLARATGQAYDVDPVLLEAVHGFVGQFSGPGQEAAREGLFGPEVPVSVDAPLLDRVLGMTGRDPSWRSPVAPCR